MKDCRVRALPSGFAVINGEGSRISPVVRSQDAAMDWLDRRIAAQKPQRRPCLSCDKSFESAGIHDRLCPECGRASGALNGGSFTAPAVPKRTASR